MRGRCLGWVGLGLISCLSASIAAPLDMQSERLASWWKFGENVRYRLNAPLPDTPAETLSGVVTNSAGEEVARISIPASQEEWVWTPSQPGFYEVAFSIQMANGAARPLQTSYAMRAPNGVTKEFPRSRQSFAVIPDRAFPANSTPQFGFANYSPNIEDLQLAQLIGFNLVRLTAHWGPDGCGMTKDDVIESVKGQYNWTGFDKQVSMYTAAGFAIYAQIYGTPYWASPHPEKAGTINICVDAATAYAPLDNADWGRFLEALLQRYGSQIRLWEIGNEPAMPGGSCFWLDTPENYLRMLKSGYDTIKKIQPNSEVWIGGLGANSFYFAFYDRILSLGGANAFDGLSLHGSWNSPREKFRAIEQRWKVSPKPAFNSEWHAILQGNMQNVPLLTEDALALRMMRDLLHQLKEGMTRTIAFEIKNLVERETLEFALENKWFVHSAGLFRKRPRVEPRLPGVVLANFLIATGRHATFDKEFALTANATAVSLQTANGPLLILWSDRTPLNIDVVKAFATTRSRLTDWEGRECALSNANPLKSSTLYYLSVPNESKITSEIRTDTLISPRLSERLSRPAPTSRLGSQPLFKTVNDPVALQNLPWIDQNWRRLSLSKESSGNPRFTARAAFASTPAGLDVVVEVTDPVHVQNETTAWWSGDSVQIALDCENSGLAGGNTELLFALTSQGPISRKILAAEPHGNIPANWSAAGHPATHTAIQIARDGEITRYQARIPWSELYPLIHEDGQSLHAAIVINNNDGNGRTECLEWAGGIARTKDPSLYGTLRPDAKP